MGDPLPAPTWGNTSSSDKQVQYKRDEHNRALLLWLSLLEHLAELRSLPLRFDGLAFSQPPVQRWIVQESATAHKEGLVERISEMVTVPFPEERIACAQALVQLFDVENDWGHLVNSVDPALWSAPVGGKSCHTDFNLHSATVAAVNVHVRGLSNHDALGPRINDLFL